MQFLLKKSVFAAASCQLRPRSRPGLALALRWDEAPRLAMDSVSNAVACAGVVTTEQKAGPKAKGLEYLPKSPATLFVWALRRSRACKPGLCPQVNSRIANLPRAVPDVLS